MAQARPARWSSPAPASGATPTASASTASPGHWGCTVGTSASTRSWSRPPAASWPARRSPAGTRPTGLPRRHPARGRGRPRSMTFVLSKAVHQRLSGRQAPTLPGRSISGMGGRDGICGHQPTAAQASLARLARLADAIRATAPSRPCTTSAAPPSPRTPPGPQRHPPRAMASLRDLAVAILRARLARRRRRAAPPRPRRHPTPRPPGHHLPVNRRSRALPTPWHERGPCSDGGRACQRHVTSGGRGQVALRRHQVRWLTLRPCGSRTTGSSSVSRKPAATANTGLAWFSRLMRRTTRFIASMSSAYWVISATARTASR
jgi:hypothetical protein